MRTTVQLNGDRGEEVHEDRHARVNLNGDLLICNLDGEVTTTWYKGAWKSVTVTATH